MVRSGERGPYAKTAQVRSRIRVAATAVFAEDGFYGATMKKIAQQAGISEKGLAHHFASKDDLLQAVIADHESHLRAQDVWSASGVEILSTLINSIRDDSEHRELVEIHSVLSAEASSVGHPAHAHYAERYRKLQQILEGVFASLIADGQVEIGLSPTELAAIYIALSDGLQLQWLYDSETVRAADVLRSFMTTVVPALATDNAAGSSRAGRS